MLFKCSKFFIIAIILRFSTCQEYDNYDDGDDMEHYNYSHHDNHQDEHDHDHGVTASSLSPVEVTVDSNGNTQDTLSSSPTTELVLNTTLITPEQVSSSAIPDTSSSFAKPVAFRSNDALNTTSTSSSLSPDHQEYPCVSIKFDAKISINYLSEDGSQQQTQLTGGNMNGELNHTEKCKPRQKLMIKYEQITNCFLELWYVLIIIINKLFIFLLKKS